MGRRVEKLEDPTVDLKAERKEENGLGWPGDREEVHQPHPLDGVMAASGESARSRSNLTCRRLHDERTLGTVQTGDLSTPRRWYHLAEAKRKGREKEERRKRKREVPITRVRLAMGWGGGSIASKHAWSEPDRPLWFHMKIHRCNG
jgi:hypothetical protein